MSDSQYCKNTDLFSSQIYKNAVVTHPKTVTAETGIPERFSECKGILLRSKPSHLLNNSASRLSLKTQEITSRHVRVYHDHNPIIFSISFCVNTSPRFACALASAISRVSSSRAISFLEKGATRATGTAWRLITK